MSNIFEALASIRGKRALLIGDAMLDTYLFGETLRVSREAPVLVVRKQNEEYRLGGAANTAANLAALGVKTEFLGHIGQDTAGEQIITQLQKADVLVENIHRNHRTTAQKTRVLAGAMGTSKQQVLRIDDEAISPLPDKAVEELAHSLQAHADPASGAPAPDVIVVSDYGMGTIRGPVIEVVQSLARQGKQVCVDSRYNLTAFSGVTAITPNLPEAESLVGFSINDQDTANRAGTLLMERLHLNCCLLTQGQYGMTLFSRGETEPDHIPIVGGDEVTDVTGAGDTVMSTFAACLAAGLPTTTGMRLANCAAGVVVNKLGTVAASPEEISALARDFNVDLRA